ncbi:MAG: hypothetical protein PHU34_09315 [Candidatus Methanoperedens sp.]|nr:hypothetical protein [Candidatus Methanoperedens sp.]
MDIDREVLKHLPESFQVWQRIETEAQRRAEQRLQEMLNRQKKATGAMGKAPVEEHSNVRVPG